jgi:hypothetical protein
MVVSYAKLKWANSNILLYSWKLLKTILKSFMDFVVSYQKVRTRIWFLTGLGEQVGRNSWHRNCRPTSKNLFTCNTSHRFEPWTTAQSGPVLSRTAYNYFFLLSDYKEMKLKKQMQQIKYYTINNSAWWKTRNNYC